MAMKDISNILYSFRRCPYAIRARMALHYSGIEYQLREVDLKNKPKSLIEFSTKGTVPVLILDSGKIIDESFDIMKYALQKHDPENLLAEDLTSKYYDLIKENDTHFVDLLKKYKYPDSFAGIKQSEIRASIEEKFLQRYEDMLVESGYLLGVKTIADYALIPFIRQFAYVDKEWFFESKYHNIINWLKSFIEDDLSFEQVIMRKSTPWQDL